jgi:GNAT superfamily N-acetyltransferase
LKTPFWAKKNVQMLYQVIFNCLKLGKNSNVLLNHKRERADGVREIPFSDQLSSIYTETFKKYNQIKETVKEKCKHLGYFINDNLCGVASFLTIKKYEMQMIDLILIGVSTQHQRQGIGTKLVDELKKYGDKIVVWSDKNAVSFYEKQGFSKNTELGNALTTKTYRTAYSQFMCMGLVDEEVEVLIGDMSKTKFKIAKPSKVEKLQTIKSLDNALITQKMLFADDLIGCLTINKNSQKKIQKLAKKNEKIFRKFKKLTNKKIYPPVEVFHHDKINYGVIAIDDIPAFTLISEYSGKVTEWTPYLSNNDSIMNYYGDMVINPTDCGNLAKYVSGINNLNGEEENVKSMKFILENKIRIILYAARNIQKGEILRYDYNGGKKCGYDTNHFINLKGKIFF